MPRSGLPLRGEASAKRLRFVEGRSIRQLNRPHRKPAAPRRESAASLAAPRHVSVTAVKFSQLGTVPMSSRQQEAVARPVMCMAPTQRQEAAMGAHAMRTIRRARTLDEIRGLSAYKLPRSWHDEVIRAFKMSCVDVHRRSQLVEKGSSRSTPVRFRAGGAELPQTHSRHPHKRWAGVAGLW